MELESIGADGFQVDGFNNERREDGGISLIYYSKIIIQKKLIILYCRTRVPQKKGKAPFVILLIR